MLSPSRCFLRSQGADKATTFKIDLSHANEGEELIAPQEFVSHLLTQLGARVHCARAAGA
jgi:hypothetical protein